MKFIKTTTAVVFYLLFFSNIALVHAGPCGDTGGNCYLTDCTGRDAETNNTLSQTSAAANAGCVAEYGSNYVCCTVNGSPVSNGVAKTKSGGDTVTILGKSVNTSSLNGFLEVAVAVAKWIEGIVGSLALLMFIYGGFVLLLSQGSSDKVTKGKAIIVGAVIGLVIVFVSWAVINFIITGIGGTANWSVSP